MVDSSLTETQRFLTHRRYAVEHLKRVDASPQFHLSPAQHHCRAALALAVHALERAAAARVGWGGAEAERHPLRPLAEAAAALLACGEGLSERSGALFDEELARQGAALAQATVALGLHPSSCDQEALAAPSAALDAGALDAGAGTSVALTTALASCGACGSTANLEEDEDNPGCFYCIPCWQSYDAEWADADLTGDAAGYSSGGGAAPPPPPLQQQQQQQQQPKSLPKSQHVGRLDLDGDVGLGFAVALRGRGVAAYSSGELLALRGSPGAADPPLRDRWRTLRPGGFRPGGAAAAAAADEAVVGTALMDGVAAMDAMLLRLPQPWAPRSRREEADRPSPTKRLGSSNGQARGSVKVKGPARGRVCTAPPSAPTWGATTAEAPLPACAKASAGGGASAGWATDEGNSECSTGEAAVGSACGLTPGTTGAAGAASEAALGLTDEGKEVTGAAEACNRDHKRGMGADTAAPAAVVSTSESAGPYSNTMDYFE